MPDQNDTQSSAPTVPGVASVPTGAATTGESLNIGGGVGQSVEAPVAEPVRQADPPKHGWWWGTGRRKTAVARVRLKPGSGDIKVQISGKQFKTVEEYFTEERDRQKVHAALKATNTDGKMDVIVRLEGGGYMGQAGAVLLGIARALVSYDPNTMDALRDHGYLTRDPREVERKKYGQAGARRRFQFSKR